MQEKAMMELDGSSQEDLESVGHKSPEFLALPCVGGFGGTCGAITRYQVVCRNVPGSIFSGTSSRVVLTEVQQYAQR